VSSTAFAMAAEALPAPTTTVRPGGAWGRCVPTTLAGSAAATAASNIDRRSWRGSSSKAQILIRREGSEADIHPVEKTHEVKHL